MLRSVDLCDNMQKNPIKIGEEEKIKMIDAPVSGGVMGAKNATLNIMVGGSKEAFEIALVTSPSFFNKLYGLKCS